MSGDPVSWLLIEPGWEVVGSDGVKIGHVDEVAGDSSVDVFGGLAVSIGALGKPRYVPAEQVGTITVGRVELTLTREELRRLGEYVEPPTSAEIEPESASMKERIEEPIEAPIHARLEQMNVARRVAFWFRSVLRR